MESVVGFIRQNSALIGFVAASSILTAVGYGKGVFDERQTRTETQRPNNMVNVNELVQAIAEGALDQQIIHTADEQKNIIVHDFRSVSARLKKNMDETTCPICYNRYYPFSKTHPHSRVRYMKCGHAICKSCATTIGPLCPICRKRSRVVIPDELSPPKTRKSKNKSI